MCQLIEHLFDASWQKVSRKFIKTTIARIVGEIQYPIRFWKCRDCIWDKFFISWSECFIQIILSLSRYALHWSIYADSIGLISSDNGQQNKCLFVRFYLLNYLQYFEGRMLSSWSIFNFGQFDKMALKSPSSANFQPIFTSMKVVKVKYLEV